MSNVHRDLEFKKQLSTISFLLFAIPLLLPGLFLLIGSIGWVLEGDLVTASVCLVFMTFWATVYALFLRLPKNRLTVSNNYIFYENCFLKQYIKIDQAFESVQFASVNPSLGRVGRMHQDFVLTWMENEQRREFRYRHIPNSQTDQDLYMLAKDIAGPIAQRLKTQLKKGIRIELPASNPRCEIDHFGLHVFHRNYNSRHKYQELEQLIPWIRCKFKIKGSACYFDIEHKYSGSYPPNFNLHGINALPIYQLICEMVKRS